MNTKSTRRSFIWALLASLFTVPLTALGFKRKAKLTPTMKERVMAYWTMKSPYNKLHGVEDIEPGLYNTSMAHELIPYQESVVKDGVTFQYPTTLTERRENKMKIERRKQTNLVLYGTNEEALIHFMIEKGMVLPYDQAMAIFIDKTWTFPHKKA